MLDITCGPQAKKIMQDIFSTLKDTPIPTILVVSGILFLLLSVANQFAGKISIDPARQRLAVVIGSILITLGIGLYILPTAPTPEIEIRSDGKSSSTGLARTDPEIRPDERTEPSLRKPKYGALEGRVTNQDGEAILMMIDLHRDGERIGRELSKVEMGGFFQFLKVKPGTHEIHVADLWRSNYRPQRIKNVKVKPGVLTTLDLKLSEGHDLQKVDNPVTKEQPIAAETDP